jgi:hypothetical protein
MNEIIVECPHCKNPVIIFELNCCIFRHAVFKQNNEQINPHSPKDICEKYIQENSIYGCGKPFKIIFQNEKYIAAECDYL